MNDTYEKIEFTNDFTKEIEEATGLPLETVINLESKS